eukprot:TRINITY_DN2767_c1_g1_i2.p1 TRINITY_DN2767_c1_g1~~TRINITY_DN2767_c1_g1_i2.p1  ORF type:complete len:1574 (-),score=435.37 TRINITY_DN2767_c1_g1_i2:50-4309(-)
MEELSHNTRAVNPWVSYYNTHKIPVFTFCAHSTPISADNFIYELAHHSARLFGPTLETLEDAEAVTSLAKDFLKKFSALTSESPCEIDEIHMIASKVVDSFNTENKEVSQSSSVTNKISNLLKGSHRLNSVRTQSRPNIRRIITTKPFLDDIMDTIIATINRIRDHTADIRINVILFRQKLNSNLPKKPRKKEKNSALQISESGIFFKVNRALLEDYARRHRKNDPKASGSVREYIKLRYLADENDVDSQNFTVDCSHLDLRGINLSKADLRGSIFIRANLAHAILKEANLSDVSFLNANLESCIMLDAIITKETEFKNANKTNLVQPSLKVKTSEDFTKLENETRFLEGQFQILLKLFNDRNSFLTTEEKRLIYLRLASFYVMTGHADHLDPSKPLHPDQFEKCRKIVNGIPTCGYSDDIIISTFDQLISTSVINDNDFLSALIETLTNLLHNLDILQSTMKDASELRRKYRNLFLEIDSKKFQIDLGNVLDKKYVCVRYFNDCRMRIAEWNADLTPENQFIHIEHINFYSGFGLNKSSLSNEQEEHLRKIFTETKPSNTTTTSSSSSLSSSQSSSFISTKIQAVSELLTLLSQVNQKKKFIDFSGVDLKYVQISPSQLSKFIGITQAKNVDGSVLEVAQDIKYHALNMYIEKKCGELEMLSDFVNNAKYLVDIISLSKSPDVSHLDAKKLSVITWHAMTTQVINPITDPNHFCHYDSKNPKITWEHFSSLPVEKIKTYLEAILEKKQYYLTPEDASVVCINIIKQNNPKIRKRKNPVYLKWKTIVSDLRPDQKSSDKFILKPESKTVTKKREMKLLFEAKKLIIRKTVSILDDIEPSDAINSLKSCLEMAYTNDDNSGSRSNNRHADDHADDLLGDDEEDDDVEVDDEDDSDDEADVDEEPQSQSPLKTQNNEEIVIDLRNCKLHHINLSKFDMSNPLVLLTPEQEKTLNPDNLKKRTAIIASTFKEVSLVSTKKFIEEFGINVNWCDEQGNTPLIMACEYTAEEGSDKKDEIYKVVDYLLRKGADINIANNSHFTALDMFCMQQKPDDRITKLLLGRNIETDIFRAVALGRFNETEQFLINGFNPNQRPGTSSRFGGLTLLQIAVERNHVAIVALLLTKGALTAVPNVNGETPLQIACRNGNFEIVELLFDYEMLPLNKDTADTLLKIAVEQSHVRVASLLVKYGIKVSPQLAVLLEDKATLEKLLVNPDVTNTLLDGGFTLLYWAIKHKKVEMVKLLLKHGANPLIASTDTPLELAVKLRSNEIVQILLTHRVKDSRHNGNVMVVPPNVDNSLVEAVKLGDADLVKMFLDANWSPCPESSPGKLLHMACESGYVDIINLLLERGVSVLEKDNHGNLAFHTAASHNQRKALIVLFEHFFKLKDVTVGSSLAEMLKIHPYKLAKAFSVLENPNWEKD